MILLISFFSFSPEQLAVVIVGALASVGVTQWFKGASGLAGVGASLAAFVISFGVALTAFVVSQILAGGFSPAQIPAAGLQIFALATLVYKTMLADRS
jgi:hypothetical protein